MPDEQVTADDFLQNANFHKLPPKEQIDLLRKVDPEFAKLHPNDQGKRVNAARDIVAPMPHEEAVKDKGFFSTLYDDVTGMLPSYSKEEGLKAGGILGAVRHPYDNFIKPGVAATADVLKQAQEETNPVAKVGRYAAAAIPVLGPMMNQAGNELGSGQYGQGLAHTLEATAPMMPKNMRALGAVAVPAKLGALGDAAVAAGTELIPNKFKKAYSAASQKWNVEPPERKEVTKLKNAISDPVKDPMPVEAPPDKFGVSKPKATGLPSLPMRTTEGLVEHPDSFGVSKPGKKLPQDFWRTTEDLNPEEIPTEVPEKGMLDKVPENDPRWNVFKGTEESPTTTDLLKEQIHPSQDIQGAQKAQILRNRLEQLKDDAPTKQNILNLTKEWAKNRQAKDPSSVRASDATIKKSLELELKKIGYPSTQAKIGNIADSTFMKHLSEELAKLT